MNSVVDIKNLDIIGYSDALIEGHTFLIVPPIFRFRDRPNRILVPPYHFEEELLHRATEISVEEIRELHDKDEVVIFRTIPFAARLGFDLWIDESDVPHYISRK